MNIYEFFVVLLQVTVRVSGIAFLLTFVVGIFSYIFFDSALDVDSLFVKIGAIFSVSSFLLFVLTFRVDTAQNQDQSNKINPTTNKREGTWSTSSNEKKGEELDQ